MSTSPAKLNLGLSGFKLNTPDIYLLMSGCLFMAISHVLRDRVGVVVKLEDLIIQSRLHWYGHVMHGNINSQICEVMEVEITGKKKKD